MKLLLAFTRTAFQKFTVYRLDFWANLFSVFVMMYAGGYVWRALYAQNPDAFGVSAEQMTTYGILGMLLPWLIGVANDVGFYLSNQIKQGTIEIDMMKPLDFIWHMLCRNGGDFLVNLAIRGVLGFLFALFFLNFQLPPSALVFVAFLLSVVMSYLVFFFISFLVGSLAAIVLDVRSYTWAIFSLIRFADGQWVPLWLFPSALATFLWLLPFQTMYFAPITIYVGATRGGVVTTLLLQAFWCLALWLVSRTVWARLSRRIIVQGG